MHSATIIIPLSKEEALKKMIQEFLTILSRQNSSCMARYWMQVCCESMKTVAVEGRRCVF